MPSDLAPAVWEAVFSPRGADGYPARIWCKDPNDASCEYGRINKTVAAYWRDHFDMTHKLRAEWASGLGDKLSGKLHVFVGGSDTFFLTNAVMDLQDWAKDPSLSPPFGGEIVIGAHDGRGYEHCFNGFMPDGTVACGSPDFKLSNQPHVACACVLVSCLSACACMGRTWMPSRKCSIMHAGPMR